MAYASPKIISEMIDEEPSVFVMPVLVAAAVFYEAAAVVQYAIAAETALAAAVALVAGAVTYVQHGKSC